MASVFAPVKETSADEFRRVMEVTFLGYVHGTQAALRRMLPRDSGVIVQVGSALAYRLRLRPRRSFGAAHHGGREVWVVAPVVKAIIGDRIAPGLLDRLLASRGYDAQQTGEAEDANRPDNLWNPVPGGYGSHGRFDNLARRSSLQFWVARHKRTLAACVAMALGGATGWNRYAVAKS